MSAQAQAPVHPSARLTDIRWKIRTGDFGQGDIDYLLDLAQVAARVADRGRTHRTAVIADLIRNTPLDPGAQA